MKHALSLNEKRATKSMKPKELEGIIDHPGKEWGMCRHLFYMGFFWNGDLFYMVDT